MHLLVIEAPTTGSGLWIIPAARQLGLEVTLTTADVGRYRAEPPIGALADARIVTCDTSDPNAIIAALREAGGHPVSGLVCLTDAEVEVAAQVAAILKLPFASPRAVHAARNKDTFRRVCQETGLPSPRWGIARSADDALVAAEETGYPCVIKPLRGSGSRGVTLVSGPSELTRAYSALLARGVASAVLLEEYLRGPLVSLEVLVYDGLATLLGVSDRILTAPPHFVELGEGFPLQLDEHTHASLVALATEVTQALEFRIGPAHIEVILTADGPKLVEVNPRLAGGVYGPMMCAALSYDIYKAIISVAIGRCPELDSRIEGAASGLGIYPRRAGIFRGLRGIDIARTFPGFADIVHRAPLGASITPPPNRDGEIAYIWATGPTLPIAAANVRAAHSVIEVVVELLSSGWRLHERWAVTWGRRH